MRLTLPERSLNELQVTSLLVAMRADLALRNSRGESPGLSSNHAFEPQLLGFQPQAQMWDTSTLKLFSSFDGWTAGLCSWFWIGRTPLLLAVRAALAAGVQGDGPWLLPIRLMLEAPTSLESNHDPSVATLCFAPHAPAHRAHDLS